MDCGLVAWWASKLVRDTVLGRKCNNERKIEMY
jgi:hypothetical protein